MRKFLRRYLPSHEAIKKNRWAGYFGAYLTHPNLWHLNRRSVAGGVAVGLFAGLVPGPVQLMGAVLLSLLFRVNLPVAAVATLYTNPFTIVPLYALAYKLGTLVAGNHGRFAPDDLVWPELTWENWHTAMLDWLVSLGKPLAVGLPLLAICLAIIGYLMVRVLWHVFVLIEWRKRAAHQRKRHARREEAD